MKKALLISAAAIAFAVGTPAQAAVSVGPGTCDNALPNPDSIACAGYYSGNLLNNSEADQQNQIDALALIGGNFDGNFDALTASGRVITSLTNGNQLIFDTALSGITFIGAHFGNVAGPEGNVSVFWKFDLAPGTTSISLADTQGFSNAALYSTETPVVPEPATWAMMLLGFGFLGAAMRRRPKTREKVQFAL